jgi:hypothetical protein
MLKIRNQSNYNTVIISSDSQDELGQTFIRFQEHYESCNPDFKGKIFTLGQFKSWYSSRYGSDTYHIDWMGFNFPSTVLQPFRQGLFDPLTAKEIELLSLLKYRHDNFYIVGANDGVVLKHELSHALYYNDTSYRNKINKLFQKYGKEITKIKNYILDKGYHKDVLYDELQAYILDGDDEFIIQHAPKSLILSIVKLHHYYNKGSENET